MQTRTIVCYKKRKSFFFTNLNMNGKINNSEMGRRKKGGRMRRRRWTFVAPGLEYNPVASA
jgi:hypothetical protein